MLDAIKQGLVITSKWFCISAKTVFHTGDAAEVCWFGFEKGVLTD